MSNRWNWAATRIAADEDACAEESQRSSAPTFVFHWIRCLVWADSSYAGKLVDWATTQLKLTVQIGAKVAGQTTSSSCTAGGR
jgi:hypothetical protein